MFRIVAAVMMVVLSIACPPAMFVTIPAGVLWLIRILERRAETRRVIRVFEEYQAEQERVKAFRAW